MEGSVGEYKSTILQQRVLLSLWVVADLALIESGEILIKCSLTTHSSLFSLFLIEL